MSYASTAVKKLRYLIDRDSDRLIVLEKNNGAFITVALDTPQARDAAVSSAVNDLLAGVPGALDTLNELAAALGDDPNFATTITTALGNRLAWRGNWAATTAYVRNDIVLFNGGLYAAPNSFTSGGAFVKANWTELAPQNGTFANASSPQLSGTVKIVNKVSGAVTPIIDLTGFGRRFQGPAIDTSNGGGGRDIVLLDMFSYRRVSDLVIANGSSTVTSATQARFGIKDNGAPIACFTGFTGIPAGTTLVWVAGTDSATSARLSQPATDSNTITATIGLDDGASLTDLFYINEGGGQGLSFGFGITPPPVSHRVVIAADDAVSSQGNLRLRIGPSQAGDAITVIDSSNAILASLDWTGRWVTPKVRTSLTLEDAALTSAWQWSFPGGGVLRLKYLSTAQTVLDYNTDKSAIFYGNVTVSGNLTINDTKNIVLSTGTGTKIGTAATQKLAFYNATPVVQPSGTPAAATDLATVISLANSLRTSLLALGLVA